MSEEQEPFVFDWTILQSKRLKFDPQPPEDDTVPPLSDCDGDQCTIGWTPPPNTAELVATMKKKEGVSWK